MHVWEPIPVNSTAQFHGNIYLVYEWGQSERSLRVSLGVVVVLARIGVESKFGNWNLILQYDSKLGRHGDPRSLLLLLSGRNIITGRCCLENVTISWSHIYHLVLFLHDEHNELKSDWEVRLIEIDTPEHPQWLSKQHCTWLLGS